MKGKLILLILFLFMAYGCNKDWEYNLENNRTDRETRNRTSVELNDRMNYTETVLGDVKNNPFEVSNLERARDSLCIDTNMVINATHKLIRFKNLTGEKLKQLGKDTGLILMDYPFQYRVDTMADYYHDNAFDEDEIPYFYSVVLEGKSISNEYDYDVLEEYSYDFSKPLLIVESFRITNNFQYVNDYISWRDFLPDGDKVCGKKILLPEGDCPPECTWKLILTDIYPVTYDWQCDCTGSGTGSGGGGPSTNACGCAISALTNVPAGCIKVETDMSGKEGVRYIEVLVADSWGQFLFPKKTKTTVGGCWQLNERMSGNIWIWTRFFNEYSYERGLRGPDLFWEIILPIKDYIGRYKKPFNNIYTLYEMGGSTEQEVLWAAATANNQVQLFNGLAASDGINILPAILDIFVTHLTTSGATLMMNQAVSLGSITGMPHPFILPDISLGIRDTRRLQNHLAFHEFAHASHFTLVGNYWWGQLLEAEFVNSSEFTIDFHLEIFQFELDPYGDGSNPLDPYIAVAESWAEHIGRKFAGFDTEDLTLNSGYIPEGLYEDLIDSGTEPTFITDDVSGYTMATLFSNLTVTNIPQLKSALLPLLPAGNTTGAYNSLFASYGY